ncbi:CDK5RAP1-like protein [Arctopsyche grandis]|uniref:CDK5RAP1-like protein n=1 Tax=Arctopsyche grandis TaxID=121162 RepID=UPI00406D8785
MMKSINNLLIKNRLFLSNHLRNGVNYLSSEPSEIRNVDFKNNIKNGPGLGDFINLSKTEDYSATEESIPYLNNSIGSKRRKVLFEIYGCQMNLNDTEVVWSILKSNNFSKTDNIKEADVVLIITCAIREGAENKIWHRLQHLKAVKKKRTRRHLKIGILGCMAERLKTQLIVKEQAVDLVAGPDSYKDLPRLLAITENNQTAVNVLLSLDETYADVMPVRLNENSKSAYVSIMRGCDNMCTYCIVPFTRGKERSRPVESILDEVRQLSEQGVKEVTLLGQNVNSYRDLSIDEQSDAATNMPRGFKTVYKVKKGGLRFADLLDKVSLIDPEMRIRFTSAHPKDFPDELLQIVKERRNICNSLHLPAQSGSTTVLERMRRGYTRESYLELIDHVKEYIPGVSITSDFICGFCSETDEEFEDTLSLLEIVKYNMAYIFPYSMREKTTAHRRYEDDVPKEVKAVRVSRMMEVYNRNATMLNLAQIGSTQLILIEGCAKKVDTLIGRNEGNNIVFVPDVEVPEDCLSSGGRKMGAGDYVAVKIIDGRTHNLKATPLYHTSLATFKNLDHGDDSLSAKFTIHQY